MVQYRAILIVQENVCNKAKKRNKSRFLDFKKRNKTLKKKKSNDM